MHLVVVHSWLESRGRPFRCLPGSRSRLNLRVLRPLTRGPHSQASPLRTPRGRLGSQEIFSISRAQVPHIWPLVHHSMATSFPMPRGCCVALSVPSSTVLICYRLGTTRSRAPRPISAPVPASRFPLPGGCCPALATPLPWPRHIIPSLIPCFNLTRLPVNLWCTPAGSSSIRKPIHARCMGLFYLLLIARALAAFSWPVFDWR